MPIAQRSVTGANSTSIYSLQMPVPVPRPSKPCAHPVLKPHNRNLPQNLQYQHIVSLSRTGFSPSLGENWLPTWPTTTLRFPSDKVSAYPHAQDFFPGLTVSADVAVIKGVHAEAYIPPMHNLLQEHNAVATQNFTAHRSTTSSGTHDVDLGFTMSAGAWNVGQGTKGGSHLAACGHASLLNPHGDALAPCFTPILEDHSPSSVSGPDIRSSPLEPLTPFTDFVNRAVSATELDAQPDNFGLDVAHHQDKQEILHVPTFPSIADVPKPQEQASTTSPTTTSGYKKLVEPVSEWIANYIWRVCTTGYNLPLAFLQTSYVHGSSQLRQTNIDCRPSTSRWAPEAPSHLAPCVQSILLATLLQPSAIYLSLWYMVRLPVYFSAAPLGADLAKAAAFQSAFLGDFQLPLEREANERNAPLHLIVLGFMLANKWLDDHTFSNKTWCVSCRLHVTSILIFLL